MRGENEGELQVSNASERRTLFLKMAGRPEGVSASEVYRRAVELGDTVTEEAYYNLARRLAHRGLLVSTQAARGTQYKLGAYAESQWLEEDQLSALIDPEYPLLAITIWKEAQRQINEVPEKLWVELRERLRGQPARDLFYCAIVSYCEDFHAQIAYIVELENSLTPELAGLRQEAENSRLLLRGLVQYGLGLSREAISLPISINAAISEFKQTGIASYVNEAVLQEELARRIAPEPVVVDIAEDAPGGHLLIGAVDGSTRGGMLSFLGEEGDFNVGYAPMISINTAIGQVNRHLRSGNRTAPVFLRLPEKPEDMQLQDNRYTVMAKLLYPDMSDAQYMHAVWNGMDLIEAKIALRLLKRWDIPQSGVEVPATDIVLRDGTVSPQDRDFVHYSQGTSYGQIVRGMIETNWEIARKCREDHQTIAGVVKNAQLSVFAPVINWFACQVAREKGSQLASWPLMTMNHSPDQVILSRLLTAGSKKGAPWTRTCVVLRPFHALTDFAESYSRNEPPAQSVLDEYHKTQSMPDKLSPTRKIFWETLFRPDSDAYMKMLENVFYAGVFIGVVPRLDIGKTLPRFELMVPAPTHEDAGDPWPSVQPHLDRLIKALHQNPFDVSAEHSMFQNDTKLDVLPRLIIEAHETVKYWAAELLSRVQEYVGYYLARYVRNKRFRGVKVRPFTRGELELLYSQLKQERELQAGVSRPSLKLEE